jgi:hypothetical protein
MVSRREFTAMTLGALLAKEWKIPACVEYGYNDANALA